MIITTAVWPGPSVVQPAIDRAIAMRLAVTEYQRVIEVVDALQSEEWSRPTDRRAWNVRQLVAHITGMANLFSTPLELARQMRGARAREGPGQQGVDALTAFEVEKCQHLGPEELRAELRRVGPRGAKGRRRVPGFVRRRRLPGSEAVKGVPETWSVGYLTDVILTRDPWMHRIDLVRATGRALVLTADHDGLIVADVVAEWAHRHGQPYRLELTGPAGGSWSSGTGGDEIVMDAAEFCRVVSGRPGPDGSPSLGAARYPGSLLSARRRFMYIHRIGDVTVLNDSIEIPGLGFLPVNAYVLYAEQPVVIDTGLSTVDKDFVSALAEVIDPADVRWLWITHPDRDHTGGLWKLLQAAPSARLVTTFLGLGIMSCEWAIPPRSRLPAQPGPGSRRR